MNKGLLRKHIKGYFKDLERDKNFNKKEIDERKERTQFFQSWTKEKILAMTKDDFSNFISKLWAMLIWGNKQYVVDKVIQDNGFQEIKKGLADLIWGDDPIEKRWDYFRDNFKGMGPATMSEILCHVHPNKCMLWNRRAYVGFRYLEVNDLPRYDYQMTGEKYAKLSKTCLEIADEMEKEGFNEPTLLTVDYFIWQELQVEDNLSQIHKNKIPLEGKPEEGEIDSKASDFIHDEIRDKLSDIGQWLGFSGKTEIKVADGSKVDTVWEATIGNMGRVIYIFEVQTKGSIDSLILNLLKSLNNPAVQGVVAVSDAPQLEKIKKHAKSVQGLGDKLRYWDYKEVLQVHEALESVNEAINSLGLVPQGF